MTMSQPPFTFIHPANILLAGPSGSGKTHFLVRALERGLFYPRPSRIVWIYGEEHGIPSELADLSAQGALPSIEYRKNETNYEDLVDEFDATQTNLLVLDDQMNEGKANMKHFANIFTKGSHHRNITVVLMVQNLFEDGYRTISRNSHYHVVFKNPRDQRQVLVFGSQVFPGKPDFIRDAYADATKLPYTYLLFDLHPTTLEELRVKASVTSKSVTVYVPPSFTDLKT